MKQGDSIIFGLFLHCKDKIAIIDDTKHYTYTELSSRIDDFTDYLKNNAILPYSTVAINSDYSFDAIALLFALFKNKNIVVPIISKVEQEIAHKLNIAHTDYVIWFNQSHVECKKLFPKMPKHPLIEKLHSLNHSGLILFSSGSTGDPKAMLHNFDVLIESYKGKKQKNIKTLIFLTFDHIGGIDTLLRVFSIGGTIAIPPTRSPKDICKMIEAHKINVLPSSPTFLNLLLMGDFPKLYDLSSLSIIAFGAEAMPESLLKRMNGTFPSVQLQQKFGTSETSALRIKNKANDSLLIKIEDNHQAYKVVDSELWIKSNLQILGYLNAPMDAFSDDGWFRTGDLVEEYEDGYIKIIGRKKEIINIGGEKVFPSEVESVILTMKNIEDCMVYGTKNVITGEMVVCDVVLRTPCDTIKQKIRLYCKDKLENFKIPTKVNCVEKTNFGERFKKIRKV